MSDFLQRLQKAAENVWGWIVSLPIIKPLYSLLYSRKAMISAAVVAFMLEYWPKLVPFEDEVLLVVSQVVVIVLVAIANSLGIAIEDAAEKGNSNGGAVG
jgi:hypothetical protein